MNTARKAVVLLSGGLDSATCLAVAKSQGYVCHALSFDYGQRHQIELESASRLAQSLGACEHRVVKLDVATFHGSALTDRHLDVPKAGTSEAIPVTYVPARNTVFRALALAWAEVLDAEAIFIGVNAVDYSGYPDCRPEYIDAFQRLIDLATRKTVQGAPIVIHTPLIELSKAQIITLGHRLGVDFSRTVSCYDPDQFGRACGACDSCRLRREGFEQAGIADPTRYTDQ